ncbi:hypothetical protein KC19_10G046100 [Ceratodon purpureus]|uniref:Secreted protein n=1 Tax=Ceratodon purpureus TaxID=3225 RepID=A0A8T0GLR3_CERPU|nr:hypothetical protein KC19_10G046100 [Ceratodon purpureus]
MCRVSWTLYSGSLMLIAIESWSLRSSICNKLGNDQRHVTAHVQTKNLKLSRWVNFFFTRTSCLSKFLEQEENLKISEWPFRIFL